MLRQIRRDAADCVAEVRRIVSDLHPPALDDVGLLGALRRQADLLTSRSDGLLQVTVDGSEAGALSSAVEVAAYRIATEAMANTARHAAATRCRVTVRHDGALHVSVVDDGNGVPPARPGTGLTSMRERAEELGGSCTATFSPGAGTRVEALLPTPPVATR
jgi:signal transduction histidine kinase